MIARALPRRSANRWLDELRFFVWRIEAWATLGEKGNAPSGGVPVEGFGEPRLSASPS
jgi:hypothetical protein